MMLAADRIEHMGFHQIHEREQVMIFVGEVNDRLEEFLTISGEIVPAYNLGAQGCWRDAQVMRSFRDAVDGQFSRILGCEEVNDYFAHEIELSSQTALGFTIW